MNDSLYGELTVIGMRGTERFTSQVDSYLKAWREVETSFIIKPDCIRFQNGEAKCIIDKSLRGHDVYILTDLYNYSQTYKMYGQEYPMSPDDHFQDLKRIICAIAGKAHRISVIMPLLYESRQDKRSAKARESLDCALALQELARLGVSNFITFDVHNSAVQNAIPLVGFDNVHPTYQMIKSLIKNVPDIEIDPEKTMIISPDEGGMSRCMYYSSMLGLDLGMFYKRRDYSKVVDGHNLIVAHEYLGRDVAGKDVIVVDDIISSGESMLDVASKLKAKGARRIFIFASFGMFCNGYEKFDEAYKNGVFNRIFTTNLIYSTDELLSKEWYVNVNLTKYVSLIIETLNHDHSINEILNPAERIKKLLAERQ